MCRSREGAWIEIFIWTVKKTAKIGRSREGAWIEICMDTILTSLIIVAPVRERGLKFVWYEYTTYSPAVAPVRERGLKLYHKLFPIIIHCRSREGAWIEMSRACTYFSIGTWSLP